MADEKKPSEEQQLVMGKPIDELDLEDVMEAVEKGELELPTLPKPPIHETFTLDNLEKFLLGDMTWAQLQGMTMEEAHNIAEYGYKLFTEGRYHDARTIFEGLILCNPYDAYFHNMLGATFQQLDMREEAMESYNMAIELDAEHLHAYVNRGELRLQSGDFDRALDDLRKAVELDIECKTEAGVRATALTRAIYQVLKDLEDAGK